MNSIASEREAGTATTRCGGICAIAAPALMAENASVQSLWATTPVRQRLRILCDARLRMAQQTAAFADAVSPTLARSRADTLVTELLPLLDGIRFLERNAVALLAPRKLGRGGRPFWLSGVAAEIRREALGHVLVIAPANFPLFLAGSQVMQALAAGNSVTWKPGAEARPVAELVAGTLAEAGLPAGLLTVTDDTIDAARSALAAAPDKVIFTGSHSAGVAVLEELAKTATPAVVELSGVDAVILMPDADLALAAKAIAFGLRLNGSAVCMSPRRVFANGAVLQRLRPLLLDALAATPAVALNAATAQRLTTLVDEAVGQGAHIIGKLNTQAQQPLLIDQARTGMEITRADIFAPVLSLIEAPSLLHLLEAYSACPYSLTASIFCSSAELGKARKLAAMLRAGTVLINDIIAPTADPRVPFGGRAASGYGVTRGAEGLLEMTAVKTVLARKRGSTRHFAATTEADFPLFESVVRASHARSVVSRFAAIKQLIGAARSAAAKR